MNMTLSVFETQSVSKSHIINRMSAYELEDVFESINKNVTDILSNDEVKDMVKKYRLLSNNLPPHTHRIGNINYFLKKVSINNINDLYLATPFSYNSEDALNKVNKVTFDLVSKYNKFVFSPISYFTSFTKDEKIKLDWNTWEFQCKLYMNTINNLLINCVDDSIKKSIEMINNSNGTIGEINYYKDLIKKGNDSIFYLIKANQDDYDVYELIEIG